MLLKRYFSTGTKSIAAAARHKKALQELVEDSPYKFK